MTVAAIWNFRHDADIGGQLIQIVAGVIIWATFVHLGLKLTIISYESGKGDEQRREIERENDQLPSRLGWYRTVFCLRIAASAAFILEGLRFGEGWPSFLLTGFGVGSWLILSPYRKWMK